MAHVLIVYGTTEGHTDEVVAAVSKPLVTAGHGVTAARVQQAPVTPSGFDGVIVGSSIHMGKHDKRIVEWISRNRGVLATMPSAFFQVSLASASGDKGAAEARGYVDQLIEQTQWHPDPVGIFAGALLYTRYGFVKRRLLKKIAGDNGLGTDTHRDFDYTDYDAVAKFGRQCAAALEQPPAK